MIIPLVADEDWLDAFRDLPALTLPDRPVLMVVPHPDDEVLGAGALIATLRREGISVTVIAATDGENAYDTAEEERVQLRATREREQTAALDSLGVSSEQIRRLRLPDSGLMQVEERLTQEVSRIATDDMLLLAPWVGDFHPDHEVCGRAAATVADARGLPLLSYFFWTWHRGTPGLLEGLSLKKFDVDEDALAAKLNALSFHRSQLIRTADEPILPERLLAPAQWTFEVFLSA